ncbi:LuxR C-terminal-related transcriptional regulator [Rhodanobacter sp. PCA2]|uniref:LuxR C-terminal-related transcriptional regulator n=1 Tax=Rhodanobacter sp. PCA2 TaxID=2006117 RepID=UPI0015E699FE|nr:LuxR C-terminal-related transcriptional regulator [Rhodanobacter sp. PCA2]
MKSPMPTTSILSIGKFEPPSQRVALTPRLALLDRLQAWREYALTLVISPPGFGKTTLLTQWHEQLNLQRDVVAAWLTLSEDGVEPARFLADMILSLQRAGLDVGELESIAENGLLEASAKAVLSSLMGQIVTSKSAVILILDDYQLAQSNGTNEIIETMLRHGAHNLHLAISSRDPPSIHLSTLIARGVVQTISASDLMLSLDESAVLFAGLLSADEHASLYARSEGWAVVSQLARIWMQHQADREHSLNDFSGRHVDVANYLSEQVLQDLPQALQDFLTDASVFERFCAALLDEVRECNDSARLLNQLNHLDALLIPLDHKRKWFRFHPLFGDFLRNHLRMHRPERMSPLRLRASQWFLRQGDLLEAVRQAVHAKSLASAVELIDQAGSWQLIMSHGIGFVSNLLQLFPPSTIDQYPLLLIVKAYLCIKRGEWSEVHRCLDLARATMVSDESSTRNAYTIINALRQGYCDESDNRAQIEKLDCFTRSLDASDRVTRATAYAVCAVCAIALAEFSLGERYSQDGISDMRAGNCIVGITYCLFHLGQSFYYRGDWKRAESVFAESLEMAEANFGKDSMLKAVAGSLMAKLLYDRNRLTEASALIDASLDVIEHQDGWFDIYALACETSVRIAFAEQGHKAGIAKLQHVRTYAKLRDLRELEYLVDAWQYEYEVAEHDGPSSTCAKTWPEGHFPDKQGSDWRLRHAWAIARIRRALASAQYSRALQWAESELASCTAHGRRAHAAMFHALSALALKGRGELPQAMRRFIEALGFAAEAQATRMFFQLGPAIESLIRDLLGDTRNLPLIDPRREFLLRVQRELHADQDAETGHLSHREFEVLRELYRGHSNKSIGRMLGLSENTVKFHLKQIYRKLNVDSRTAALSEARRLSLQPDAD